jgi:hypothetical protein
MFTTVTDSTKILKYTITNEGVTVDISGDTVELLLKNQQTGEGQKFEADVSTGVAIFEAILKLPPGIYDVELDMITDDTRTIVVRRDVWKLLPKIEVE